MFVLAQTVQIIYMYSPYTTYYKQKIFFLFLIAGHNVVYTIVLQFFLLTVSVIIISSCSFMTLDTFDNASKSLFKFSSV